MQSGHLDHGDQDHAFGCTLPERSFISLLDDVYAAIGGLQQASDSREQVNPQLERQVRQRIQVVRGPAVGVHHT